MSMNLRDARKELLYAVEAGNAVLTVSPSGFGKSDMNRQIFAYLKASQPNVNWGYGEIFAATQTPPDLIGFQFKGEREYPILDKQGAQINTKKVTITDPSVPLWMLSKPFGDDPGFKPAFMYDRYYLNIEEYGQGEPDTKRGIAEIFLNGGTAPWYLPAGSIRVANSNEGARYGVTKDFDFCIARRTRIDVHFDVNVWVEDFADKPYWYQGQQWQVSPITKTWALQNPQVLSEKEPEKQGPWCNPRTATAADRYIQVKARHAAGGKVEPDDPLMMEHLAGTMGMPGTQSYVQMLQFRLQLPSYQDVTNDPTGTPVPSKADLQMLMAYELASQQQRGQDVAKVLTYIQRLPKDMAITYIGALLRRDYRGVINEPAMQAFVNKNAALITLISSLSQV